ncbi:protein NDNF-like [Latimeria chalumnae]|nr:PREDICTED: protein NDNF-like [Latimeria chalumnae]|eukprot:XP_014350356.1 PREDICTED: protein NDNF-like [Latimeria chalumnae]
MGIVFRFKGNSVETYAGMSSHNTLYTLELLSTEKDAHTTVYLTTDIKSQPLYPELPSDPRMDIIGIGHTTVTLSWKPSPPVLQDKHNIQYCLLVNQEHNYKSLCAAETSMKFSNRFEPSSFVMSIRSDLQKTQAPKFKYSKDLLQLFNDLNLIYRGSSSDVRHICIGTNTVYTVPNLSPNTQYYFDVFVINLFTNASAAYTGTFAKTLEESQPKIMELKEGSLTQVNIKGKGQKLYRFRPQAGHRRIQFIFQSCSGHVRVYIQRNGRTLVSAIVSGLKYFTLKGKPMEMYIVQLKSTASTGSSVKVQASTQFHKHLFPLLPESLKIKSFSKLRTCHSITIAWLGTQERSKYCVYKKRIEADQIKTELKTANRCSDPETRRQSEKVLCKFFYEVNLQRAVTTETIKELEPGVIYLFDIYLIERSGISIKYQSKVVKTRKEC